MDVRILMFMDVTDGLFSTHWCVS